MMFKFVIAAAIAAAASAGAARAGELKPMHAQSIDLGTISGVAYYTVAPEGYRVVATLAEVEGGAPVRFEAVLVSGQSVTLSTPRGAGMPPISVEISRTDDRVSVIDTIATN